MAPPSGKVSSTDKSPTPQADTSAQPLPVECKPSKFLSWPFYDHYCDDLKRNQQAYYAEFERLYKVPTRFHGPTGTIFLEDTWSLEARGNLKAIMMENNQTGNLSMKTEMLAHSGPDAVRHELFHVWMRQVLGPEADYRLPQWFREGLAIYTAGQLEEKMEDLLVDQPPGTLIRDISTGHLENAWLYYPQFALTVEYIEKVYGNEGALGILLRKLAEGIPFDQALRLVAKVSADARHFYEKARAYAYQHLEEYDFDQTYQFLEMAGSFDPSFLTEAYQDDQKSSYPHLRDKIMALGKIFQDSGNPKERESAKRKLKKFEIGLKKYKGKVFRQLTNILIGAVNLVLQDYKEAASFFKKEIDRRQGTAFAEEAYYTYGLALALHDPERFRDEIIQSWETVRRFAERDTWRRGTVLQIQRYLRGLPIDRWSW